MAANRIYSPNYFPGALTASDLLYPTAALSPRSIHVFAPVTEAITTLSVAISQVVGVTPTHKLELYDNSGTLLAGSNFSPVLGWNTVTIPSTTITQGERYEIRVSYVSGTIGPSNSISIGGLYGVDKIHMPSYGRENAVTTIDTALCAMLMGKYGNPYTFAATYYSNVANTFAQGQSVNFASDTKLVDFSFPLIRYGSPSGSTGLVVCDSNNNVLYTSPTTHLNTSIPTTMTMMKFVVDFTFLKDTKYHIYYTQPGAYTQTDNISLRVFATKKPDYPAAGQAVLDASHGAGESRSIVRILDGTTPATPTTEDIMFDYTEAVPSSTPLVGFGGGYGGVSRGYGQALSPGIPNTELVSQNADIGIAATSPTLTQLHNITVANASHSVVSTSPTITQLHNLSIDNSSLSITSGNIVLLQNYNLAVQNASHTITAEQPPLTSQLSVLPDNAIFGTSSDNVILQQAHLISVDDTTQDITSTNITVSETIGVNSDSALIGISVSNIELSQQTILGAHNSSFRIDADKISLIEFDKNEYENGVFNPVRIGFGQLEDGGIIEPGIYKPEKINNKEYAATDVDEEGIYRYN